MDTTTKRILDYCVAIIRREQCWGKTDIRQSHSARCIEVPWLTSHLVDFQGCRLLDIGTALSSLDYMGTLLATKEILGLDLHFIDIVKLDAVKSRYPQEWWPSVMALNQYCGDYRYYQLPKNNFDVVTCISVIEHIGYDVSSQGDDKSVFVRKKNIQDVCTDRAPHTDRLVMDKTSQILKKQGELFITVPMGKGGPVVIQDSLGYYCVQWEYEQESWMNIIRHKDFELVEERYFQFTEHEFWEEVSGFEKLSNVSASNLSQSNGCAMARMRKVR